MTSRARRALPAAALAVGALAGSAACEVRTEEPSWEPPVAAEERVERMWQRADAHPPGGQESAD